MQPILDAILAGAPAEELAALPLPESYRAAVVLASEQEMFAGVESDDKDPRKSLHVQEVPVPELAPDEAVIAVMASSINFNTVWTSIFEPLPTFGFLNRLGKESGGGAATTSPSTSWARMRRAWSCGSARRCATGSRATGSWCTATTSTTRTRRPQRLDAGRNQRIWGFETNYGGLADLALVKANQLMPKPAHLTLGGGGRQRAVRLDQLPHAGRRQRRGHEAG